MTDVSAVIEQTIRLQQQTNHWQAVCLVMIFICNGLIVLSVLNIRKATRINREWSESNRRWSEALSAASGTPTRRAETIGSVGEADGGPTLEEGDAHE